MIPHDRIRKLAETQGMLRDESYGKQNGLKEVWETMSLDDLASGAKYKIGRATQIQISKEKALDDLIDAYNYVAALYERLASF